ncbi:hypothetical protein T4B_4919 [Trichinella pseudospiralis]|uniref:Uncharacterized protein n=1 Tax=Trichinella pseudospiralis TaxID=6337 RepID=A0A0V1K8Y8_TRIPS|nr:hypothetical protein T4B_4919 [Trichinella pseudospiralis]KRZ43413.1 hypothetical protein T4C_7027 [Trichinella pseudospiralis]
MVRALFATACSVTDEQVLRKDFSTPSISKAEPDCHALLDGSTRLSDLADQVTVPCLRSATCSNLYQVHHQHSISHSGLLTGFMLFSTFSNGYDVLLFPPSLQLSIQALLISLSSHQTIHPICCAVAPVSFHRHMFASLRAGSYLIVLLRIGLCGR